VLKPKQSRRLSAGGDHAMTSNSTNSAALQSQAETAIHLLDDWFDPIPKAPSQPRQFALVSALRVEC
jgi:hypothetical protein